MMNCGIRTTAGGRMMAPRTIANQKFRKGNLNLASPYADRLDVTSVASTVGITMMSVFRKYSRNGDVDIAVA